MSEQATGHRPRDEDREVLADLLCGFSGRREARRLADRFLSRFGGLAAVIRADAAELAEVEGCTPRVSTGLGNVWRLLERATRRELAQRPLLDAPDTAKLYCRLLVAGEQRERLHVIFLDRGWRITGQTCLQKGTLDHVAVYPREIVARAIAAGAAAIILVHNHPSGNGQPSKADLQMTSRLAATLSGLGMEIADHILVSGAEAVSFRQQGLLGLHPD